MVINGTTYKKKEVAMYLAYNDLLIVVVYLLAIAYLKYMQTIDEEEYPYEVYTCSDFSIDIQPMPPHKNLIDLKAELWRWIDDRLKQIHDD
jgi:hypothetical protein